MDFPKLSSKLIVLGLTLLAFLLRAYRLDFQSLWIDEAWTVYFAHLSMAELWHLLQTTEIMPPLYHPSTIYWVRLFGESEYALRYYSLVFGVMAIPFTFRLGQDLGDDRLGLIAALLMAVAPYQIWHSQEARMYSILTAASVMSMWGFVNLWQRGGWRWWLVYLVGTEWAIMVHYHAFILIGVQGLFLLLTWRRNWRSYLYWGAGLLVIFLLYIPWLIFGSNLLESYVNWVPPSTLWASLLRSAIAYSLNELVPAAQAVPLALIFVVVYVIGLIYASNRSWGVWRGSEMLALLISYTLVPHLAAWVYGEIRTVVYLERYMILVQVGYLLTIAVGILGLADGLPAVIRSLRPTITLIRLQRGGYLVATLTLLFLVGINGWVLSHHYFDPAYAKDNWRAVGQTIANFGLPGDAILLTGDGGENALAYYYRGDLPVYANFNLYPPTHPDYKKGRPGIDRAEQIMSDLAATHRRIWYTPYGVTIDATLESWFAEHSYPAWHSWLGRKRLALYGTQVNHGRLETLNFTFADAQGHGPTLTNLALPQETTAAGDLLPLTLVWQTAAPLAADYQLSLRLVNQRGDIFAQSDWPPLAATGGTSTWLPGQSITDRRSLWLPADLPPGQYALQLVLYDPVSDQVVGQPLTIDNIPVSPAEIVVPPEALPIPNRISNSSSRISNLKSSISHLTLIGYSLPEQIQPGQEMWLWLYWQASTSFAPAADRGIRLSLNSQGETVSTDFPVTDSLGPLDSWQPGQVRRAIYHLPTSPRLSGAAAEVTVSLIGPDGQVEEKIPLTRIALTARPRRFESPPIAHTTGIAFGQPESIKLIGYDLPQTTFGSGDTLPLNLYWQAQAEMEVNYIVFVQLVSNAGQVVGQVDLPPLAGAAPTTTWLPGEILTDPYSLPLPPDLASGHYRLISGLYDPASGARLPVSTGGDFVELGQITVE